MNKYKLNFLRWITDGKIPNAVLKTATNWKIKNDGRYSFKIKVHPNSFGGWKIFRGSCQ